jgi:hypothetical protein
MADPRKMYLIGLAIAGLCVLAIIGALVIRDWVSAVALALCCALSLAGARVNYKWARRS